MVCDYYIYYIIYDILIINKNNKFTFAEVTAADRKVASATDAVLTCSITGITQTFSVTWKNSDDEDLSTKAEYAISPETLNTDTQDSTLTITTAGLAALGDTTDFTCYVKSGQYPTNSPEISKTIGMTKLNYGTCILLLFVAQRIIYNVYIILIVK